MPHFPGGISTQDGHISSSAISERTRIKNRRKRYLDLHPEYFESSDLELADPLLYDRLVRQFKSLEEREKEGREKGFTKVMEHDMVRSEAKVAALQNPDPSSSIVYKRAANGNIVGVEQDAEDRATTKESGWERWTDAMGRRFIAGDDPDFDYAVVDANEEYDDRNEEDRVELENYLENEPAEFVGEGAPIGETGVLDY
ncbi:unnamed protein product [Zymoseptoria tritici ST99CH_1A5]|uniref:CCD97-like C-terminal domain-containing protein n=3 Tax=Zymoseptoria tritici TaxID=1047171 RepID=A0A1X7RPH6_ZYMT9|nr:unnamed protein product [Zymoseptoria tritici ST99CH_3D7]SMR48947.1 unnamed protein product [Zymoseptoria tritici ST99CH_1E4]SMR50133.1 unnamed protein product [Zymoseptoria tritici ST99CH_3D1]SMY22832.1 unnamed protein product [Zymoseptoria tritici ST99CH_1A5]